MMSVQTVDAKPKYSAGAYYSDLMTVSGRAELPNATGSLMENMVQAGGLNIDSKIVEDMKTESAAIEGALRAGLERSLKNHHFFGPLEQGQGPQNIYDFAVRYVAVSEANDKIDIMVALDATSGSQTAICPTISSKGHITVLRRKVYKKGQKFVSGALGLFNVAADPLLSKNQISAADAPNATQLAWDGMGVELSPYDSDDDTKWFGYQKAMQLAITNFLYQLRPSASCNRPK